MEVNFKDKIIEELGVMELADEYRKNPFPMKAYTTAIEALRGLDRPITTLDDVNGVKGVGEKIKLKIKEIIETGSLKAAEEAKRTLPLEAYKVLKDIHGIGPSKAAELIGKGITTLDQLRTAAASNSKLLTNAQRLGIKYYENSLRRIPRAEMMEHESLVLSALDDQFEATVVGSYRRGAASSGDIDILLTLPDSMSKKDQADLFEHMIDLLKEVYIVDTLSSGKTKFLGYCRIDEEHPVRRLDLLMIPKAEYACAILYFTGSKEFNVAFRSYALEKGYTLNEHRLEAKKEGVPAVPLFETEKDIFDFLGLQYVDPDKRKDGKDVKPL